MWLILIIRMILSAAILNLELLFNLVTWADLANYGNCCITISQMLQLFAVANVLDFVCVETLAAPFCAYIFTDLAVSRDS